MKRTSLVAVFASSEFPELSRESYWLRLMSHVSYLPPEWALQWSQVVSAIGSLILSALLVVLYKRQQEQLAADNKAWLTVGSVEWDRDEATIHLSNLGNGAVANLTLVTLAYVETGEHRQFCTKRMGMKRLDKEGTWANVIQAEEEDVELTGKSRVGRLTPKDHPMDWMRTSFSSFILELKNMGVEEVKFLHVVEGTELSKTRTLATVQDTPRSVNPQEFERENSLEDLPSVTLYSYDTTFESFFDRSAYYKARRWLWYKIVWLINRISGPIQTPVPDVSGRRFIKRAILQRALESRSPFHDSEPRE